MPTLSPGTEPRKPNPSCLPRLTPSASFVPAQRGGVPFQTGRSSKERPRPCPGPLARDAAETFWRSAGREVPLGWRVPQGLLDDLDPGSRAELGQNVGDVGLDGVAGQEQPGRGVGG